ncbi:MAG TPA: biotin--[acetyl-CoA-carboxylase] ligase [Polyangiaceae bacterium]|jgi:BirA family biotin operon repressor/biotin-[acetyl-CoA-carboxylase] ligase|nr:biotin--[acetyl-CoA-carboxylase] ligase [Polyangiaceae bacterium]
MAFDADSFRVRAREQKPKLGRPLMYKPVTGSTNDDALLAARSGAPHGSVFVADEQTAGRGRRGHSWLAAPGEDLLFSVLLRPKLELPQTSALTLAIGLALRDAVSQRIAESADLKWPNDLLVNGKKLAGILVESQLQGDRLQAVVVGIGLNVASREFPSEIAARATSLALLGSTRLEREPLLYDVLQAISARLDAYQNTGVAGILGELNTVDALRGKRVRVDAQVGIGRGLDEHGRLLLEDDAGRIHAILSGTVELL